MQTRAVFFRIVALAGALLAAGCAAHGAEPKQPSLDDTRKEGSSTSSADTAGGWLLRELVSPGGDAKRAKQARAKLDTLGQGGMIASLARAFDDGMHGRIAAAAEHYLETVRAARDSQDERAPLIAWFAANRAIAYSDEAPELWKRWQPFVEQLLAEPRWAGWRARSELVEWSVDEAWAAGTTDVDRRVVSLYGCLTSARLAGPFGRGVSADATRKFAPENPGPWPYRWEPDPGVAKAPLELPTEAHSCALTSDERPGEGVYYVETAFDVPSERDLLLSVQGALAVRVDDALVLERDVRNWGVWPRFGVLLHLKQGRHRVVARIGEPSTSIRLLRPDGVPSGIVASADSDAPYEITPPEVVGSANVLERWIRNGDVVDAGDDVTRLIAAFMAHVESSDDVASVMTAPLIEKVERAPGPTLSFAALFADDDPIFEASQASDLVRELHERAVKKDPELWASRLSLAMGQAEKKGAEEAVPELERLSAEFPGVPDVLLALGRVYGELGWSGDHSRVVKELLRRFPNNLGALHAALDVYDAEGDSRTGDDIVARIQRLDRDDDVVTTRALAREDWKTAIADLERLAKQHAERKELAERIAETRERAGEHRSLASSLEAAVYKEPTNSRARLDLADAHYALLMNDRELTPNAEKFYTLHHALADAVQAGANPSAISNAIDLVEGSTELEPYRLDARELIRAYEKSGRTMPGTAARILDYAALWIRGDGSSRMLEHEIIRLQSEEAISTFAEHRALEGLVLHMRVIKRDGTTLEPEFIAGKPTVTFPHLEVGDYIETEQVIFTPSEGHGIVYMGPRWFFREENVGYARSEFVVVSPENRDLVVETTGAVPAPVVEHHDGLVTRRWRVEESPAAVTEPGSAPITEFLPSVRIGWGVTLDRRLEALGDALTQVTPVDPRIARIARHIVEPLPPSDELGRAKKLYRWLLDNVEPGDESDGRRVIIGRHGNLWQGFRMLCRALGLRVRYAVAESRLAPPPEGPISGATLFSQPVAAIETPHDTAWLTLGNKYAPFGYVSADLRGMPAYFLDGAREKTRVPDRGPEDEISFSGSGKLDSQGGLTMELIEQFGGKLGIALRRGLSQVPEQQLHDALESNLLAQTLHGGSLLKFSIEHRDDFDSPLVIRMSVQVSRFAQPDGKLLVFAPPLAPNLDRLATLPTRQTPLLMSEPLRRAIAVDIELPKGATVAAMPEAKVVEGDRRVAVQDTFGNGVLHLKRNIDLPAGRIQVDQYARFAAFARQADDALSRAIHIRIP